jgi:multidrug efflux pump subunit AcrA (membrane-fusion protein)
MNTRMKWSLGTAGVAAVATVSILGWLGAEDPTPDPAGHEYKEVTVERGRFRLAVSASGLVRPIDRIELKSKASGEVTRLPIEVGDRVEKGALIAQLDQLEERAALAQAEADLEIARAELELAEKNFERRKQLFSSKVIAKEARDETELELAVARSKLVQATTALERARERMQDSVISAPVDGIILQKYVESGQIIASGVSNVGGGTPMRSTSARSAWDRPPRSGPMPIPTRSTKGRSYASPPRRGWSRTSPSSTSWSKSRTPTAISDRA